MTKLGRRGASQRVGRCLLIGDWGPLAKSHLIPDAFMRPVEGQVAFLESKGTSRPLIRHTGWYGRL